MSTHGGNDLDGTPASIRVLPAIAGTAGDQVEVLLVRAGLGSVLVGLGHSSIADLSRDDPVVPPGFERHLEVPGADTPLLS